MREFRIVTNGKKYRVQARRRRLANRCLGIGWSFLLHLPKEPPNPRGLVPFEFDTFKEAKALMDDKVKTERKKVEASRKDRWTVVEIEPHELNDFYDTGVNG